MRRSIALSMLALALGTVRCSATGGAQGSGGDPGTGGASAAGGASGGGGSGGFGALDSGSDAPLGPPTGARLTGKVLGPHPDGRPALFPVSGAAIIAYPDVPPVIPSGVFCEECVTLPTDVRYALSGPDGSFTLDLPTGAHVYLSVQKGQFRRLREYTTPAVVGEVALPEDMTTLPHKQAQGQGDTVPKIALVYGDYDHIEDVLAKTGFGQDDGAYGLSWGTEGGFFDVYDNSGPGEVHHGANLDLLIKDPARLAQYQVILFECSYNANFDFMKDAAVQKNLKDWVWAGGKLYVSDYAMPVAEQPWHDFAWFTNPLTDGCNENDFPPTCNHGPPFDTQATVPDAPLAAWLDAQGLLANLLIKENWDTIGATAPGVVGRNPSTGADVSAPPKVWVQGPWSYTDSDLTGFNKDPSTWNHDEHPLTVSWPYNCGRVLFTTYHTVGGTSGGRHPGLLPQEMLLYYLLMEITVCQELPVVH